MTTDKSTNSVAGFSSSQSNGSHHNRQLSATITAPMYASQQRARSTTPELVADSYGRRLHGLDLISTRKLAALSASTAKLEAQAASRAAAITRTVGAGGGSASGAILPSTPLGLSNTCLGPLSGAGMPPLDTRHKHMPMTAAHLQRQPGSQQQQQQQQQQLQQPSAVMPLLSPVSSLALVSAIGGLTALGGEAAPDALRMESNLKNVAERGANVVRLLALQDRILHGALQAQQQALSAQSSPSSASPVATRLRASGSSPGTVVPWADGAAGGGGGGVRGGTGPEELTPEEQRRLDQLGIRHDSKVAAATVRLFRLTPRATIDGPTSTPATPPNSQRGANLPGARGLWAAPGDTDFLLGSLQSRSHTQLSKSREFQTMTRFLQSLPLGDEESLISQARSFARYGVCALSPHDERRGSPPSSGPLSRSITSPSPRTAHAPVSLPPAPLASSYSFGDGPVGGRAGPPGSTAAAGLPETPGAESAPAVSAAVGLSGTSRVRLRTPPSLGQAPEGSLPQTPGGTRGLASPSKRALAKSLHLDLSAISTGQPRHRDMLDGLIRAVELFVGEGGGPAGVVAGGGGGGLDSREGSREASPRKKAGNGGEGEEAADGGETDMDTAVVSVLDLLAAMAEAASKAQQDPVTPFGGVYGSPERMVDVVRKKGALAVLSNPAGYREEVAAGEVAMYREVAERCRGALAQATKYPRDRAKLADLQRQLFSLHHCRPYFIAPRETLPEVVLPLRSVSPRGLSRQSSAPPFFLSSPELVAESVFLSRVETSEAEDMVDGDSVRERQVRKDWNRVVRKDAFRALVGGTDPGVGAGSTGLGHALDACLAVLLQHKDSLKAAYNYYASMGPSTSDTCFALTPSGWRAFVADCGLTANLPPPTANPGARSRLPSAVQPKHADAGGSVAPQPQLPQPAPGAMGAGALGVASSGGVGPRTRTSGGPRDLAASSGGGAVGMGWGGAGAGGEASGGGGGGPPKTAEGGAHSHGHGHGQPRQPPNFTVDAIFTAVHSEAEKRLIDGQVNTERTLLRFEWYEALIRMATMRHIQAMPADKKCASIAAALDHMWVTEVLPSLPAAAAHEPNQWRIARLYGDTDVNRLLLEHLDLLMALYDYATCYRPDQLMHLGDWIGLLHSCELIGDSTGLNLHTAKLCFLRSLLLVVDELGGWRRAVCGDRADFLEALARLAEEMQPPPIEEIAEALREVGLYGRELKAAMVHPWLQFYTTVPPENLVARREAAAAAARSTTAGEEPPPPPPPPPVVMQSRPGTRARRVTITSGPPAQPSQVPSAAAPGTSATAGASANGHIPALPRVPAASAGTSAAPNTSAEVSMKATSLGTKLAARAAGGGLAGGGASAHPAGAQVEAQTPPPAPDPSTISIMSSSTASSAPPSPRLSFCLAALLDLLLGRLRAQWECGEDNGKLAGRLRAAAAAGWEKSGVHVGAAAAAGLGAGYSAAAGSAAGAPGLGSPQHHVLHIHPRPHSPQHA